jgi:hypothetical protein
VIAAAVVVSRHNRESAATLVTDEEPRQEVGGGGTPAGKEMLARPKPALDRIPGFVVDDAEGLTRDSLPLGLGGGSGIRADRCLDSCATRAG